MASQLDETGGADTDGAGRERGKPESRGGPGASGGTGGTGGAEGDRGMDILRLATAGSVDDGKSTLIGRLLYDSKAIFEDQLASVERTSKERGEDFTNLALLTDGLRAGPEQGIPIDVPDRELTPP